MEASEELGVTKSVITGFWQRFQEYGNVSRRYNSGCPQVTTPNEDRCLSVTLKRSRRSKVSDMSHQLSQATVTTISKQTVR
ncbi:HTH_Tnp_Tc3_2 domain-containing protein [Trichonephila clavipes]|nr:HTH_Tnp_Tc3_2 domain-containing protein [Trichonephila clavipes]